MPLRCPACPKLFMTPRLDEESGLEIDTCPECLGMWFDGNELSRFLEGGSLKREFQRIADAEPLQSVGFTIDTRARRCPRCRISLEERLFSDVTLDICAQCQGLFMDDGELRRVILKYQKGDRGDELVREQLDRGFGRKPVESVPVVGAVVSFLRRFVG